MANSGLLGPFSLTTDCIDTAVREASAGVYALGTTLANTFNIAYVGRCDSDLRARLKAWVGHYREFKFVCFDSPQAAFEKECSLFHDFGGPTLDNKVHPGRRRGTDWKCLRCARLSSGVNVAAVLSHPSS
jgi:hypothetical protein